MDYFCNVINKVINDMKRIIEYLLSAVRKFTVCDFAVLKLFLCIVGILLGMYFHEFFRSFEIWVWGIAVILWITVLIRLVVCGIRDS